MHAPLQLVSPAAQLAAQAPCEQTRPAWQAAAQVPQLLGLVEVSTQPSAQVAYPA
jgi:hypothetical protein